MHTRLVFAGSLLLLTGWAAVQVASATTPPPSVVAAAGALAASAPKVTQTNTWTGSALSSGGGAQPDAGAAASGPTSCTATLDIPYPLAGWMWTNSSVTCTPDVTEVEMLTCITVTPGIPATICHHIVEPARVGSDSVFREDFPGPQIWYASLTYCATSETNTSRCWGAQTPAVSH